MMMATASTISFPTISAHDDFSLPTPPSSALATAAAVKLNLPIFFFGPPAPMQWVKRSEAATKSNRDLGIIYRVS